MTSWSRPVLPSASSKRAVLARLPLVTRGDAFRLPAAPLVITPPTAPLAAPLAASPAAPAIAPTAWAFCLRGVGWLPPPLCLRGEGEASARTVAATLWGW